MPTCEMLTAERYFEIRLERIEEERQRQLARANEVPGQAIVQRASIEAADVYQKGALAQLRDDLKHGLETLEINEWVSWVMFIPKNARQSEDRLETISGYVTQIVNYTNAAVKIQCNPEKTDAHGYSYNDTATVPLNCITQVMKPMPKSSATMGGPVKDYVRAGM